MANVADHIDKHRLFENHWFWMGETLLIILAGSGMVANAVLLHRFGLYKPIVRLLPRDVRYLQCNKSLSSLLISFCILLKTTLTFTRTGTDVVSYYRRTVTGSSRRFYYFDSCQYQIGLAAVSSISVMMTVVGLAMQRLLATFAALPTASFDAQIAQKQRFSAPLFLACSWLLALVVALAIVLMMPPSTLLWYQCDAVLLLPRSIVIAAVALAPIVTLISVLMQVSAWLSARSIESDGNKLQEQDTNDNPVQQLRSTYTEASLTEMTLPSILIFAVCWSVIAVYLAYERLLYNTNRHIHVSDDHSTFINSATEDYQHTSAASTYILTQYFVHFPLLVATNLDPWFTYWRRPSHTHMRLYTTTSLTTDVKEGTSDCLIQPEKPIKQLEHTASETKDAEQTLRKSVESDQSLIIMNLDEDTM